MPHKCTFLMLHVCARRMLGQWTIKQGVDAHRMHLYVHHATQEEVFKRREEALKLKDLELQESLIRFSKFLQVRAAHTSAHTSTCTQNASPMLHAAHVPRAHGMCHMHMGCATYVPRMCHVCTCVLLPVCLGLCCRFQV